MFVVTAVHDTGHGVVASPFFVTSDPKAALAAARTAANLGYQFENDGAYVSITGLTADHKHHKDEMRNIEQPFSCLKYIRLFQDGKWTEEWNPRFQERVREEQPVLDFGNEHA